MRESALRLVVVLLVSLCSADEPMQDAMAECVEFKYACSADEFIRRRCPQTCGSGAAVTLAASNSASTNRASAGAPSAAPAGRRALPATPDRLTVLRPTNGERFGPTDMVYLEFVVPTAELRRCGPNATVLFWFQDQLFDPIRDRRHFAPPPREDAAEPRRSLGHVALRAAHAFAMTGEHVLAAFVVRSVEAVHGLDKVYWSERWAEPPGGAAAVFCSAADAVHSLWSDPPRRPTERDRAVLDAIVQQSLAAAGSSDSHAIALFALVIQLRAKAVLELGSCHGHTTWPLLLGVNYTGGELDSVDMVDYGFAPNAEIGARWRFHQMSTLQFLGRLDPDARFDVVLVDDEHNYEHVKRELKLLARHVDHRSVVVLHDTMSGSAPHYTSFADDLENHMFARGGPYRAVRELARDGWEFATLPVADGLTILRKLPHD